MKKVRMERMLMKTVGFFLCLFGLVVFFQNCSPNFGTNMSSANSQEKTHFNGSQPQGGNDGGTTVGSDKTSAVKFYAYNPQPDIQLGSLKDVRLCVYKIKLWYTELYEPVIS